MNPVLAKLRFLRPDEGGRQRHPAGPHYSTLAAFEGAPSDAASGSWSLVVKFCDALDENGCVMAEVEFLSPDGPRHLLQQGTRFALLEGTCRVATGEVVASEHARVSSGATSTVPGVRLVARNA